LPEESSDKDSAELYASRKIVKGYNYYYLMCYQFDDLNIVVVASVPAESNSVLGLIDQRGAFSFWFPERESPTRWVDFSLYRGRER